VEAIIGPVHLVLAPRWAHRVPIYAALVPLCLLAVVAVGLGLFCLARYTKWIPTGIDPGQMLFSTILVAVFTVAGFSSIWPRFRVLGNRLLVGEGGLVEWTPAGGTLISAGDLGVSWVVHVPDRTNDGIPYVVFLALRHVPSGTHLYLTDFYADSVALAQLVREKLAGRMPGRWADLSRWKSKPATTTGNEITSTGPSATETTEEPR
jgi:hypothetical protein